MRVALILLAMLGCSNRSADRAGAPAKEPLAQLPEAAEPPAAQADEAPPPAPPPPAEQAEAVAGGAPSGKDLEAPPEGKSSMTGAGNAAATKRKAIEEARAVGVLGPTDRAVFEVRGKVTLSSTMKAADEALTPKLDAVQACYQKILVFEENLAGKLTLRLDAGKLTVVRTTLKHADLEKCVLDALATATLPTVGKATITLAFARE